MREYFSAEEIASVRSPELPGTARNVTALAVANGWRADPARARRAKGRGGGWEYHLSWLPPGAQARLLLKYRQAEAAPEPARPDASSALWARFEALPAKQKDEARRRLAALEAFERYRADRCTTTEAAARAATEAGTSTTTIFNWRKLCAGVARADRLAALAPGYQPTAVFADCHPRAWDMLCSDYLRPERPTFSRCYRDMRKVASKNGWLPIPSERALRRRFEAETPAGVIALARQGRKMAKTLYPAQQRSRAGLHAMQAVNMDGHELDVFVRMEDGRVTRLHLLALQDLYSGMIVAWRLSETENKETVRLVIGDMVELYGIPEKIVLDNGRAFTSKWISGQAPNRFRFKIREEDPRGVLTALGIEIVWAKPYSGQSKPIERAFRDLTDTIARHPFCAGAYTGNTPLAKPENHGARAISAADFADHVAAQITEHNEREGRKAANCAGRSFLATFEASLADPATIVSFPTDAQRALWMLAADKVRAQKGSGEIRFMGNRYWSRELNEHAGRQIVIRFDPGYLHSSVRVYTLDDRLICVAPCIAPTGFFDQAAARVHERNRAAFERSLREQKRLIASMSADEVGRLYGPQAPAAPAKPIHPRTKRLATGGASPATAAAPETEFDAEFEEAVSRGLRLVADTDVIPLRPRDPRA